MAEVTQAIETTDVLVVGGGLAGFSAAISAAAAGATVLLVEKQPTVGGSTIISGGSFAFAGSDEQRAKNIEDTSERLAQDLLKVGGQANDPRLVETYAANQAETYRWLKSIGVAFPTVFSAGGQSVPRSHRTDPRELVRKLQAAAQVTSRVAIALGNRATRLVTDAGTGEVRGAIVANERGERLVGAKGVVLASGGFSRNEVLLQTFAPAQKRAQRIGGPGSTGDGLLMACKLGAGLRDMGYIKGTFGSHPSAKPEEFKPLLAIYRGAIAVNRVGRRFVNEAISYKDIGDRCLEQEGAVAYQIFDQEIFALSDPGVPSFDMEEAYAAGRIERAATLAELAAKLGIDAAGLAATVERYNDGVARGHDGEFDRAGRSNIDYGTLTRIRTPPFYGYPCTSAVLATYCGIAVDEGMRVLDVFGEPIGRLFAAGEIVGGLHGSAYMSSSANGKAAIFGRIAGRSAATAGRSGAPAPAPDRRP